MNRLLLPLLVAVAFLASCNPTPPPGNDEIWLTRTVLNDVINAKMARTPSQQKMQSYLLAVVEQFKANGNKFDLPPALAAQTDMLQPCKAKISGGNEIYLYIYKQPSASYVTFINDLKQNNVNITDTNHHMGFVQGWAPMDKIDTLGAMSDVRHIGIVTDPLFAASPAVKGRPRLRADAAHAFGTGKGILVGVLSDDCGEAEGLLAQSKLNGALRDDAAPLPGLDNATERTHEGLAMMEIVQDIAPEATLRFATAKGPTAGENGMVAFANSIEALAMECKVITDDIVYIEEPAFEDGPIAKRMDALSSSRNIVFVSAAGNWAKNVYSFRFDPLSSQSFGKTTAWHTATIHNNADVDYKKEFSLQNGQQIDVMVQWDDAFGQAENDFDLFVVDIASGQIVASSTNTQNGTSASNPYERLTYVAAPCWGQSGYRIVISHYGGITNTKPRMKLLLLGTNDLNDGPNPRSIFGHAAAKSVIACGAMNARGNGGNYNVIEDWSSRGPVEMIQVTQPIGDLSSRPAAEVRNKPDVASLDAVSTTVPGFSVFYGTSAAAPHIAGLAAILFHATGTEAGATAGQIRSMIKALSFDYDHPAYDSLSGMGRSDAFRAAATWLANIKPNVHEAVFSHMTPEATTAGSVTTASAILVGSEIMLAGQGAGRVDKVFVAVTIDGYNGIKPLTIKVEHEGKTATLVNFSTPNTAQHLNVVFGDIAPGLLSATSPGMGFFRPVDPLSIFESVNPQGSWKLTLIYPNGVSGSLKDWGVYIKRK